MNTPRYHQRPESWAFPLWVVPVALVIILLALFGVVGHMDFMDEVQAEYGSRCPNGTIGVDGQRVTCIIEESATIKTVGVLK